MALPTNLIYDGPRQMGLVVGIYPATSYPGRLGVEIWSSTVNSTAATAWSKFTIPSATGLQYAVAVPLPKTNVLYYVKARHVGRSFSNGPLSTAISGYADDITEWRRLTAVGQPAVGEVTRRNNTLYNAEAVLKPNVTNNDGTLNLAPVKGYQQGTAHGGTAGATTWADGAAVTFAYTYDAVPNVRLFPGAGTVYLERRASVWTSSGSYNSTAPQYVELTAVNVTAAGFTPRARLIQRTTSLTARSNQFGTSNSLTAAAQATSATITNAPAYNDQYTAHYKWRTTYSKGGAGTTVSATLVVALDSNATGGYTERATNTHVATLSETTSSSGSHETIVATVTGLSATEELRLRVKSITYSPSSAFWALSVHGFDGLGGDPAAGVTHYTASTATRYAAMCPTTNDRIGWAAQSVVTG